MAQINVVSVQQADCPARIPGASRKVNVGGCCGTADTLGHGAIRLLPNTEHGWAATSLKPTQGSFRQLVPPP